MKSSPKCGPPTQKLLPSLFGAHLSVPVVAAILVACISSTTHAALTSSHAGDTDPTAEGFTVFSFGSASVTAPVANDLGNPVWSISGQAQSSQLAYYSGALAPAQETEIANHGFRLSSRVRVLQNLAPEYSAGSPTTIAAVVYDDGSHRFEIDWGLDLNGDTVVVLPTSISAGGPGGSILSPGASFTLIGAGNGYHNYELILDPATQLADLFVDGVERISDYTGHSSFVGDRGLGWGAFSGGQGNFASVRLTSGKSETTVPEAGSTLLLLSTSVGIITALRRRCASVS